MGKKPGAATPPRGYRAIAEDLSKGLGDAGERLPAESELSARYGVARDTVRRALALLVEQGLILTTHGRGHFVVGESADAGIPRWAVVARSLSEQIKAGQLGAGETLPADAQLQADFQVSRNTVRRAVKELESDGLVVRNDGRRYVRSAP